MLDPDDLDAAAAHLADAWDMIEIGLNFVDPGVRHLRLVGEYAEEIAAELGFDL